jgi:hypothetical protein
MSQKCQCCHHPASRAWSGANTQTLEESEILLTVGHPILAWNKQEKLIEGALNLHNEADGLGGSGFASIRLLQWNPLPFQPGPASSNSVAGSLLQSPAAKAVARAIRAATFGDATLGGS